MTTTTETPAETQTPDNRVTFTVEFDESWATLTDEQRAGLIDEAVDRVGKSTWARGVTVGRVS